MKIINLNTQLQKCFTKYQTFAALFKAIMNISGEIFRQVKNRHTLRFTCKNQGYFIKKHFGIGLCEIIKNLLQFRFPIFSAKNEYTAIKRLKSLGINTPEIAGYGIYGINPITIQSFIVTQEIENIIGMRDIAASWKEKTTTLNFTCKKKLLLTIAKITKTMHENGINHRDLYLAHFLLDKNFLTNYQTKTPKIYIFDLHRAQIRNKTPQRWIIKDLASLYFSSMEANLTKRDVLRFIQVYFAKPIRLALQQNQKLLQKVNQRAHKLYQTKSI